MTWYQLKRRWRMSEAPRILRLPEKERHINLDQKTTTTRAFEKKKNDITIAGEPTSVCKTTTQSKTEAVGLDS